jgi:hypothetical protein
MWLWLVLLADVAVATPGGDLSKCSMNDAPFRKLSSDPRVDRRRPSPPMVLRDASDRWLLYSNPWIDAGNSTLVDAGGYEQTPIRGHDTQLVLDEHGVLRGVISLDRGQLRLSSIMGATLWVIHRPNPRGDSAAALVAGDLLLVSVFHRIATGSSLQAFDLATGKLRWSAEVEQLNVGHSKYFNDVTLELRGETIVMRGYEAAGCYRQTFELKTGKRLSAQMPSRL